MILGLVKELKEKIDEVEDILDSDLLTERERRYIQSYLMKENRRISAMAVGMTEEELLSGAIDMMKKLFKKE